MTSKLKCPFCGGEFAGGIVRWCVKCGRIATGTVWQALIQAKEELKSAKTVIQ